MGAENGFTTFTPTHSMAPTWARTTTALTTTLAAAEHMNDPDAQPPDAPTPPEAPEQLSGASWVSGGQQEALPGPETPAVLAAAPPPAAQPPVRSPDGRVELTDTALTVRGQTFLLLELERVEVMPVRWLLWYLLGSLGLAMVMIAFLQNWLRTGPAMTGMALAALLLAYGHRGTNRLRLQRLGREAVNVALPGDTAPWQRLTAEINRRIYRVHDHAAREAAALLAAADEATRRASEAAQATEEAKALDQAGDNLSKINP